MTAALHGKTALVTGAGRGIGRAVALGLAEAGAGLVLLARSANQLAATRDVLAGKGVAPERVLTIPVDLGDQAQREQATRAALEHGRVDILINNAATVEPLGATATVSAAQLRQAFEVNVIAVAVLTVAVLPGMLEAGWGRIVNVSSGIVADPGGMVRANAYAATKAALEGHTVNLAVELEGTGVTVNAYRPGRVDTEMQAWIRGQDPDRIGPALHERFTRFAADGELITAEQSAAGLIARLAGEETGAVWKAGVAAGRP